MLQRAWHRYRRRWRWRGSRSRLPRLTLVTQFFPQAFAATGQLLDDLNHRMSAEFISARYLELFRLHLPDQQPLAAANA
ncbi:MAG: hypothetical protein VKK97_08580 [Synechococcaceae cyanobacterium]|nr:hypothetical protein [Synechococcaceae cyanobacterium]